MDEQARESLIARCTKKLQNNLEYALFHKGKIEEYKNLLSKNEDILNNTLHLICIERNPEDFGARKFYAREAQHAMYGRLEFIEDLIIYHQLFLEEVNKKNFTMVLYIAIKELGNRIDLIRDVDPFWQVTRTSGAPGPYKTSILGNYVICLEKAAACVKMLAKEDSE